MKLIRFGSPGNEKPGLILSNGTMIDVSSYVPDYNRAFFEEDRVHELRTWLNTYAETAPVIEEGVRLGPPIADPGKIICIGLNYADHAKEGGMEIPSEPILFFKATSALCGPNDPLMLPKGSKKTDWEVELALVIGKKASNVEESQAMDYVFGYCLHNDYSERQFQLEMGGQWVKGKSCDTFAPLGPFIGTKDEIKDIHNTKLWLKVNGELKQNGHTNQLIFSLPFLVSYVSRFMTLHPGDIISTGTPAGVGLGFNPPQYLTEGDVVELGIEGLGESRQEVMSFKPS